MSKGVTLIAAALCLCTAASAQEAADSLVNASDNADFTFTESQLDEDNDGSQAVSSLTSAKSDLYLSEVGFLFSPMRFRVRGYKNGYSNAYESNYMNGLQLNDIERGTFSYGMIGGLNDAVRNQEGVTPFEFNAYGFAPVGGATNINTRASQFAAGSKLALSACNRNYLVRGMFTHATGILPSGWSFAGSVGYRWANEGVIEGTFYNSFSYFLAAEKRLGNHSLSLVTFGAPTERAQQGASTEEAYYLANSHYYNPNWGYQGGKKRNARVVNSFEPTAILTWDWNIDEATRLSTSAGFTYSMYGSTALSWGGNAYDPRPDYYKNLPSSIFNVYDPTKNNPDWLEANPEYLAQYTSLRDYWFASKANRQINWDRLYAMNRQNEADGGEALYYVENRRNDRLVYALNSAFQHDIDAKQKIALGLTLNHTKGMHYKEMSDLLGASRFTDIDKFAARDYGEGSQEAQNDLNNPNRQIHVGDKFGYDYNILVSKARLWTQYRLAAGRAVYSAAGHIEGTQMERDGLMRNGRAPENSFGKSGKAHFLGGGGRFGLSYRLFAGHTVGLGLMAESAAPLARNSFVAPRMQNNYVDNLTNEQIFSVEPSYTFRVGSWLSGNVKGYYTCFNNGVEQSAFYNDSESRFTYLTMTGIDREHLGVEAAFNFRVNSKLSFNLIGTYSEAQYVNDPVAQIAYEGMDGATVAQLNVWQNPVTGVSMPLRVFADGMRVDGTPLTAVSLGVNYNTNGWFFEANLNYYDRVYVGFSPYRRLSNVVTYTRSAEESFDGQGNPVFNYTYKYKNPNEKFYTDAYVNSDTYKKNQIKTADELHETGGIVFDAATGETVERIRTEQEKFKGGFMLDASIGKFIRLAKGRSLSINLNVQNITNNQDMRTGGYEQNRSDFFDTGESRAYKFSRNSKYYYANAINAFLNIGYRF